MTRDTIYTRLRDIGCSVETADATAEALEGMNDNAVNGCIMWLCGYKWNEVCRIQHISKRDLSNAIGRALSNNRVIICDGTK